MKVELCIGVALAPVLRTIPFQRARTRPRCSAAAAAPLFRRRPQNWVSLVGRRGVSADVLVACKALYVLEVRGAGGIAIHVEKGVVKSHV